jgi:hypothetical protein
VELAFGDSLVMHRVKTSRHVAVMLLKVDNPPGYSDTRFVFQDGIGGDFSRRLTFHRRRSVTDTNILLLAFAKDGPPA